VRTSHESFATKVCDNTQKDEVGASSNAINPNEVGTSSGTRPSKRAKKDENARDGLVQVIDSSNETLSTLVDVIREVTTAKTTKATLPDGLFEGVDNLPCVEIRHKSMYYTYLGANLDIAMAFINLSLLYKVSWITSIVDEKF
jgi:hypothetical protein